MTKTIAQLRAEAVERLKNFASSDEGDGYYWDVMWSLLGKRPTEYDSSDELLSALIDLLTDDCGPCYSCAKLAELMAENNVLRAANQSEELPETPVFGNNPQETPSCGKDDDGLDSREKLEADTRVLFGWVADGAVAWGDADAAVRYFIADAISMLDRQAAIDRKEFQTILEEIQKCVRSGSR